MNTELLHLKIKWDPLILELGATEAFHKIWEHDYIDGDKWIEIYFKDLETEDKIKIVRYAGMWILNSIKKAVSEEEFLILSIFNETLDIDKAQLIQMIEEKEIKLTSEIDSLKTAIYCCNDRINQLESRLVNLELKTGTTGQNE
jgi:hypothetical protein